jgi:integrase
MNTNFYLRDKSATGETAIILFVSYPTKKRFKYYTGLHTKPINWDFDKQRTKRNAATNAILLKIEGAFNTVYSKLTTSGERVDNTNLERELLIELKRDQKEPEEVKPKEIPITTLYALLERFIAARSGLRAKGSMQRYTALKTHLLKYEKTHGGVALSKLNIEFGDAFNSFLYAQGHQKNTVGKLIVGLKVLLNWAVGSGYPIPPHYKDFEIPSAPTKIIALTEIEFLKFITVTLPKEEEVTRDLFCFSAYTGLRYSDVVRITPEMVTGNFLNITTKKTEDALKVYLIPEAKEVLTKYANKLKGLRTNQGANKGVKRIAELAGIDEPVKVTEYYGNRTVDATKPKHEFLSFHSAKKTHVTLSLKNGVRPEVLSSQIGNTMRTLKPYISIADQDKEEEIGKAFRSIRKKGTKLRAA